MEKDKKQEGRSAIELAILNGIEAYNREQAKKNARAAAKSEEKQDAKLFGKEAMEEAGLKPKRRSRAKGKGTKLPENKEEGKQPAKEQKPAQQPKKRGEKAQAVPAPKQHPDKLAQRSQRQSITGLFLQSLADYLLPARPLQPVLGQTVSFPTAASFDLPQKSLLSFYPICDIELLFIITPLF